MLCCAVLLCCMSVISEASCSLSTALWFNCLCCGFIACAVLCCHVAEVSSLGLRPHCPLR